VRQFICTDAESDYFKHGLLFRACSRCTDYAYYSLDAKHSVGRLMEIVYGAKNGVHAFGYNSAEGEPI